MIVIRENIKKEFEEEALRHLECTSDRCHLNVESLRCSDWRFTAQYICEVETQKELREGAEAECRLAKKERDEALRYTRVMHDAVYECVKALDNEFGESIVGESLPNAKKALSLTREYVKKYTAKLDSLVGAANNLYVCLSPKTILSMPRAEYECVVKLGSVLKEFIDGQN